MYEEGSPHVNKDVWDFIMTNNIPLLGICYGLQEIAHLNGGVVAKGVKREYGHAILTIQHDVPGAELFEGIGAETRVWMSHGDKVMSLPTGFANIAYSANSEHAAFANGAKKIYGIQFHPEVTHSTDGTKMISNFTLNICKCKNDWSMGSYVDEAVEVIRKKVGPTGRCIGAVSGGVDSSVGALLLHKAIGDRFHAVFVNNGLLRKNEAEEVMKRLTEGGIQLVQVDAVDLFLDALEGVEDPEKKRKIIGHKFIDVFEAEAKKLAAIHGPLNFLMQGTLYPDVIESVSFKGPSATIKTHHNVGGLKDTMSLDLIEPLRELFKDEVRSLGMELGLSEESVWRHPFPGPGLSIRMLGAIKRDQLDMLRDADAIFLEEIRKSGHYKTIGQAFAVLLPCKSVGVMGDGRTYEQVIALRAVQTTDYMTADWYHMPYEILHKASTRIINEVRGVNRVVYDVSSKPPSTIEWE